MSSTKETKEKERRSEVVTGMNDALQLKVPDKNAITANRQTIFCQQSNLLILMQLMRKEQLTPLTCIIFWLRFYVARDGVVG